MVSRTVWFFSLLLLCSAVRSSPAKEPPELVHGTCVDGAKRHLAGVRARLLQGSVEARPRRVDADGDVMSTVRVIDETTTDSIGRFWLKNEQAAEADASGLLKQPLLVLDAPGQLPEVRSLTHPIPHVVAAPKVTVAVRFIDTDKQPVTDVAARCIGGDWPNAFLEPGRGIGLEVAANKEGVMTIPLSSAKTSVWVRAPGYLPFALRLKTTKPQDLIDFGFVAHMATAEPIELQLAPSSEAVGRVVDAAGSPLPGMAVVGLVRPTGVGIGRRHPIDLRGMETVTDEQGRFKLTGLPRDWVRLIAFDQTRSAEAEALVTGLPWQTGDLMAQPMRELHGQVWDRVTNAPLSPPDEVRVAFRSTELGTRWSAAIDQRGEFAIPVPAFLDGHVRLVPHPHLSQVSGDAEVNSRRPEPLILRVQPKAAIIPDTELIAALNDFPRDYALAKDQWVRHIPAPFTKSRQAYWQFLRKESGTAPTWMKTAYIGSWLLEKPAGSMIFIAGDDGSFRCVDASPSEIRLSNLFAHAFPQFSTTRVRFGPFLLAGRPLMSEKLAFAGDIVLREGMPLAEGVRQLETLLRNECRLPVELDLTHETVETLHVRGKFDTRRMKGKMVPIRLAGDGAIGPFGSSGTPTQLVGHVANLIALPYSFEAEITGDKYVEWGTSWPPYVPSGSPNRAELEKSRTAIMRQLAPTVLREQLGLDVEIHDVSLPLVTIRQRSN